MRDEPIMLRDFRRLSDPDNPENRNAGNGGDLVKHTVYAAVLSELCARSPWRTELRIRECHAGRGIYRIPSGDSRRRRLDGLRFSDLPLARFQRRVLGRLGVEVGDWYAGSCALVAEIARGRIHEAYEWDPRTRSVLAAALDEAGLAVRVLDEGRDDHCDGEHHVQASIGRWDERDLVLLDPFGLWRHHKHRGRRARFRRILEARRPRGPVTLLFFTWGHDGRGEAADREGERGEPLARLGRMWDLPPDEEMRARSPADGYRDLRVAVNEPILRIRWHCDLRCAMWVVGGPSRALGRAVCEGLTALQSKVIPDAGIEVDLLDAAGQPPSGGSMASNADLS